MKWNINFTLLDSDICWHILSVVSVCSPAGVLLTSVTALCRLWDENKIFVLCRSQFTISTRVLLLCGEVSPLPELQVSLSQLARSDWHVQRSLRVSSSSPGSLCLRLWRSLQILQWLLPGLQLGLPAPGGDWDMRGSMSDFQAITAFHRDSLDYFKCIGT